jgi:hypothetical protein
MELRGSRIVAIVLSMELRGAWIVAIVVSMKLRGSWIVAIVVSMELRGAWIVAIVVSMGVRGSWIVTIELSMELPGSLDRGDDVARRCAALPPPVNEGQPPFRMHSRHAQWGRGLQDVSAIGGTCWHLSFEWRGGDR